MKRVIVISTSLRRGSNSDMLAEEHTVLQGLLCLSETWPLRHQ